MNSAEHTSDIKAKEAREVRFFMRPFSIALAVCSALGAVSIMVLAYCCIATFGPPDHRAVWRGAGLFLLLLALLYCAPMSWLKTKISAVKYVSVSVGAAILFGALFAWAPQQELIGEADKHRSPSGILFAFGVAAVFCVLPIARAIVRCAILERQLVPPRNE